MFRFDNGQNDNGQIEYGCEDNGRERALTYLAQVWLDAEDEEIDIEALAHAALTAGLATLVKRYGETAISELVKRLSDQVVLGEYTVDPTLQ